MKQSAKIFISVASLIIVSITMYSQTDCSSILRRAIAAYDEGKGDLDKALKYLQDTEICDYKNTLQKDRQNLQQQIFEAIKKQKQTAEKNVRASKNAALAFQKAKTDPTMALRIAQYNLEQHPDNPVAVTAFHEIISDTSYIFYKSLSLPFSDINNIVLSPNGKCFLASSDDGTARLWDLEGNEMLVLRGHTDRVTNALFSPDGSIIATSVLTEP